MIHSVSSFLATMTEVSTSNDDKNFYSIEAPGVIRSNSKYNVAVTILQTEEPCSVNLKLTGGSYNDEKSIDVRPMTTEVVEFDVPELEPGDYFFEATADGTLSFSKNIKLRFAESKPLTFIQLDKQLYKRGDKVDFRVLFLDSNTRPAEISKPTKVTIEQNQEIAVEFTDIELNTGVYTGQWNIPEDAQSGNYCIQVHMDENAIVTKSFEIIEIKEPKFKITIKGPLKVRYENEYVKLGIEAMYPDGTPVKGRCTLRIISVAGYFGIKDRPIEKYMGIDGSVENIIFSIVNDFNIDRSFITEEYFHTAALALDITVVDEINDVTENLVDELTITQQDKKRFEAGCHPYPGWRCVYPLPPSQKPISIKIYNNPPKLGDTLSFNVLVNKPTNYFVYVLTARGNIVKIELVNLEVGSTNHVVKYIADFQCVPRAFLLAYYIFDGELFFDEIGFDFNQDFQNKLEVKAPSTIEAGKEITIDIASEPNSLIGVMAIDVNSKLPEHENDLDTRQIFEALSKIRSQTPWLDGHGEYPGIISGLVTFTNAKWAGFIEGDTDGSIQMLSDREHLAFDDCMPRVDLRALEKTVQRKILERNQTFGNFLYFNRESDAEGKLTITETLPDKSTTWLLSVFALHPNSGFAMTNEPLKIEAKSDSEAELEVCTGVDNLRKLITQTIEFEADLYEQPEFIGTLDVVLPEDTEPITVEFTVGRNLLGPVIAHVAEYPTIMYCTGMLHMTTFLPNVVVLEFLQSQNQLDTDLAKNIIAKFDEAITRELAERREDGSFGWFISDKEGSPHVTAVVINALQRVSKFVEVDTEIIKEGLDYLVTRQTEDGDFIRETIPYKNLFQPNLSVGLTAAILMAFIQNEDIAANYQDTIDRAVAYIVSNLPETKCDYDLALSFCVMQKLHHPVAEELKERLLSTAFVDENKKLKWWTYSDTDNKDSHYYAPVSDKEVTSYVLFGLLDTEPVESLVPIVKWLLPYGENSLQHRSESMDCAASLDAVLSFAVKSDSCAGVTNIEFTAIGDEEYKGMARIEPNNSNIIKTFVLPSKTKKISYTTKDKGSFKGNLTYRYLEN